MKRWVTGTLIGPLALVSAYAAYILSLPNIDTLDCGNGFATRFMGSRLPHSPRYISLLKRDARGRWVVIWHSVSARLSSVTTWDGSVVFGAITSKTHVPHAEVRVLSYERATDTRVDITGPLLRRAGLNSWERLVRGEVERDGDKLRWFLFTGDSVRFETPLSQMADFAREVRGKGQVRVFDEFAVYEE